MAIETTTLTMRDACALGAICGWAQRCVKLTWMVDGVQDHGTARSIGDWQGNFAGPEADVRDEYLRITTRIGMEWFVPIREVMEMYHDGVVVEDA